MFKGIITSVVAFVVLISQDVEAMCALALKQAAEVQLLDIDSDQAWQQILHSHAQQIIDEKMANRSYKAFVQRLLNRISKSTNDSSVRTQIIEAALKEGRKVIAQRVVDLGSELQAIEASTMSSKEKSNAHTKLITATANQVLEEINIDRITWKKLAPYLNDFEVNLTEASQHFDRIILMMSNIIDRELDSTLLSEEEKVTNKEIYLRRAAAAIPVRAAEHIAKFGYFGPGGATQEQTAGYRKQRDFILKTVKRDIRLYELSWMRMAPQSAEMLLSEMPQDQKKIATRVTPEIVRRSSRSAGEVTATGELMKGMALLDPHLANAIPVFIAADLEIYGLMNSKEAKEERDERVTQIVIASNKLFTTDQAPRLEELRKRLSTEELMVYVRYFPSFLTSLKHRQLNQTGRLNGWEHAIEPTLASFEDRVKQLVAQQDFREITLATNPQNQQEGLDYSFLTEEAFHYTDDETIDGLWQPLYESLTSQKEKQVFLRHYTNMKNWVDSRVLWFMRNADDEVSLQQDLLPQAFKALRKAVQNEAENFEPDHIDPEGRAQFLRLQAQRLRDNFRVNTPLTLEEIRRLPREFQILVESAKSKNEADAIRLSWALLSSHTIGRLKLKTTNLMGWPEAKQSFFEEVFPTFKKVYEELSQAFNFDSNNLKKLSTLAYQIYYTTATELDYIQLISLEEAIELKLMKSLQDLVNESIDETQDGIRAGKTPPASAPEVKAHRLPQRFDSEDSRRLRSELRAYYHDLETLDVHRDHALQLAELNEIVAEEHRLIVEFLKTKDGKQKAQEALSVLSDKEKQIRSWSFDLNGNDSSQLNAEEKKRITKVKKLLKNLAHPSLPADQVQSEFQDLFDLNLNRKFFYDYFISQIQNDVEASHLRELHQRFVEKNLKLVFGVLREIKTSDNSEIDVLNQGNLELLKASWFYEPRTGFQFSTFAFSLIKNHLYKYTQKEKIGNIGTSTTSANQYQTIAKAMEEVRQTHGRNATPEELAEMTGLKPSRIHEVLARGRNFSMNALARASSPETTGTEISTLFSTQDNQRVGSLSEPDFVQREEERYWLSFLDRFNDPIDREILIHRFGLNREPPKTAQEIGKMLGKSRQTAFNRLNANLAALRMMIYDHTTGFQDPRIMDLARMAYRFDGFSKADQEKWAQEHKLTKEEMATLLEDAEKQAREGFEDYFFTR